MAKEITSRSASQIKSHLQKLIQKHGSYRKMMEHFKIVFKSNPNNLQEDDTSVSRQDSVREETNTIYY